MKKPGVALARVATSGGVRTMAPGRPCCSCSRAVRFSARIQSKEIAATEKRECVKRLLLASPSPRTFIRRQTIIPIARMITHLPKIPAPRGKLSGSA